MMEESGFFPTDPSESDLARMIAESEPVTLRRPTRPVGELTKRQHEVLLLVAQGLSTEAIAGRLSIRTRTVRSHLQDLYERLGAHSRSEAIAALMRGASSRR